jgi:hypothetical protein
MTSKTKKGLPIMMVILTVVSVNSWSKFPIGNTFTDWLVYFIITMLFLFQKRYWYDKSNNKNLHFVRLYTIWVLCCFVRGIFAADFYWDYKNLIAGGFALFLVYSIYIFSNPIIVKQILRTWLQYAFPLFLVFFLLIGTDIYGFYLIPISFLALFLPVVNLRWKIIIVGVSLFVIVASLEARTNVVKFIMPALFSLLFYFKKVLKSKWLKIIHIFIFALPIALLVLAITETFNVFEMDKYISTKSNTVFLNSQGQDEDLLGDSRSFLYREVISSAIKNNYVLFGRTLARGNDSATFGSHEAEELRTFRYERYSNEVSILNVFTWTGLIGIVLYFFVFFKATYLAIANSNSYFLKIIGLYGSFRWLTAWVEDFNRFDIMNVFIWIVIAMCYSKQFRKMSDRDFVIWLNGIFSKRKNNAIASCKVQPHNNLKF